MAFKNKLKDCIRCNTYFNDWTLRHYKPEIENRVSEKISFLSRQDSIADINPLIQFKHDINTNAEPFWSYDLNRTNSRIYGIHYWLFHDLYEREMESPSIEHGLIFMNRNWSDTLDTVRASCVTFGEFRREILREFYDYPVFKVGPYIQYAKDYYSQEKMKELKASLGRNLLVFPTHGTDDDAVCYQEQQFIDKIHSMQNQYDSVTACIFWWNLDSPLVKALESIGCKIVSAGFREDPMFMSRLKAIIDLSDFVIGDSIGTHIGYCINRGKPFCYFRAGTTSCLSAELPEDSIDFSAMHMKKVENAFIDSTEITEEQRKICEYYWGNGISRTREELKIMCDLTRKITLCSHGFRKFYGRKAKKLLTQLAPDSLEYKVLSEAMK